MTAPSTPITLHNVPHWQLRVHSSYHLLPHYPMRHTGSSRSPLSHCQICHIGSIGSLSLRASMHTAAYNSSHRELAYWGKGGFLVPQPGVYLLVSLLSPTFTSEYPQLLVLISLSLSPAKQELKTFLNERKEAPFSILFCFIKHVVA